MTTKPLIPESDQSADHAGGHWILARLGKKVLRPGGRETTDFLLKNLPLTGSTVVEFAPGLGVTAREILNARPSRYIGVDSDPDACANVRAILPAGPHEVRNNNATDTELEEESVDVVIGEAMLTMQTDKHKLEIMREAARILKSGGLYGIHELSLTPDGISDEVKDDIRKALARSIKVNARPITDPEWAGLAREAGFEVINIYQADMALLSLKRNLKDEGLSGVAKILSNVIRQPDLRKRVLGMRKTFRAHKENLGAVGIILQKKSTDAGVDKQS
ncbi:SAM-dependent methyltransferase [Corynebacterium suranareeae]|uniref:SAM-dependent methyltransferase n=1 Tax=Corynebacterium suranareeae TaxID=2506452 RepID=A0A160PT80_9CORY|nr:class I SAM-dependent methyltransferase [Corynebacterium suranareeae]BAU96443.1 SAM-dependent methyltransferase [Corynebacterium suranareeae]